MGSSSSGGKSKKCQQCRTRKIKCDLKVPQCSQCLSVGKTCSGPVSGNIFIMMDGQKNKRSDNEPIPGQVMQGLSPSASSGLQLPNLQLGKGRSVLQKSIPNEYIQAVGTANYDPFSTYPALPYPSEGVDRLVIFCHLLTILGADLRIIGPKIISVNPKGTWFTSALTDPVLFQSTLYSAALHFNSLWNTGDSQLAVFHRTQLLSMVNDRLRDPKQSLSDQTIAAVALIVYTEVVNGPMADYSTHMNGLKQMMMMRGKIGTSDLQALLQRMVASSTVFAAIRMNCIEPVPLASPMSLDIDKQCSSSAADKPIHLSSTMSSSTMLEKLRQHGFHPIVLLVLNDLFQIVSLFHQDACQQAAEFRQADLDAQLLYTEHRLVKYQSTEISGDNHAQRSFFVACLIFISLFLREMPGPVFLNEALTKRLRETMGSTDQISWVGVPPEVMLWMLFMGGLVATERPEKPWFVSHLSKLENSPDFRDWDSVKASLQSVLWVYKIPEESCKALCGEVITSKV